MWLYDATPTRVPAVTNGASQPHTGRAVDGHEPPHAMSGAEAGGFEMEVAAGELAPARAREAVERWLSGRVSGTLVDDVRLLVSELVTNSVRHARLTGDATIRVSVAIVGGMVRVEVEDPGDGAIAAVPPDREHGGGFGLYLVEILAERWGSSHDGKTCVWAELAVSPAT
jgi:anti-sigma regulatory factor (Ser/Thr protein kinase)